MEFLLAAVMHLSLEAKSHGEDEVAFKNRMYTCLANQTCELVQKDGYQELREIEGAVPTNRFQCVKEKTCEARWDGSEWQFDPITKG